MNLNQVTVPCLDLAISIEFYKKLGLNLIVHSNENYARFECPNGTSTFSLHKVDSIHTDSGIWIYFECEQLDEEVKRLQEKGILFDELPKNQSWLWREAKLKDPDNNQLILFYAGTNRLNPPWRI
jgi:catechol 2,3-dioxygenase-like lactoylglutathione lyase family enzyme